MSLLFEAIVPSSAFGRGGFSLSADTLGSTSHDTTLTLAAAGVLLADQDGIFFDLVDRMVRDGVLAGKHGGLQVTFTDAVAQNKALSMLEAGEDLLAYLTQRGA